MAPVREKITTAQQHVAKAQTHAAAAKKSIAAAIKLVGQSGSDPANIPDLRNALTDARDEVDALTDELLTVQAALAEAQTKLDALQKENDKQAHRLNDDEAELAKLRPAVKRVVSQRNKLILFAVLEHLAVAAFIFRKPLLSGLGSLGGFIARKAVGIPW